MERRLVELAMQGDEDAVRRRSIERIGDRLHSVARRILRDPYLAEDATQQALLDAWRHLPQLRDPDRLRGLALPTPRQRLLRRSAPRTTSSRPPPAAADATSLRSPTPRRASRHRHALDRAFRRLGVEHRTVVVLVHYLGLTPAEAARGHGDAPRHGPITAPLRPSTPALGHRGRCATEQSAGTA